MPGGEEPIPIVDGKTILFRYIKTPCAHYGDEARELYSFSGKGEVYSYTTVYEAPSGFDANAPYTVALVKLDEGPMITAQLTDVDNNAIEIGMHVEMVPARCEMMAMKEV